MSSEGVYVMIFRVMFVKRLEARKLRSRSTTRLMSADLLPAAMDLSAR